VTKVENVNGDASFAMSSGRKRYIFDFTCQVVFEALQIARANDNHENGNDDDDDDKSKEILASGDIYFPDISSTVDNYQYDVDLRWKTKPNDSSDNADELTKLCGVDFIAALRASVQKFVKEFNDHY